jgi:hypothetical protein
MSTIIFIGDKDCDLLVDLAGEILGLPVRHWEKHVGKIPDSRTFVWSIVRETFYRYYIKSLTAWTACLRINSRHIRDTYDHDINTSAVDYEYSFLRRKFVRANFIRFLSFIIG